MELSRVAGVFANRALFSATGFRPAGRALVRALGSEDENVRNIASMSLVQSGRRAEAVLQEALDRRETLPLVLSILGDIGDPASEGILSRFTDDSDPEIARSARDALRTLRAQPTDRPSDPTA
jgi:HEAT repeat protein